MNLYEALSVNESFNAAATVPPFYRPVKEPSISEPVGPIPVPSQVVRFGCVGCGFYDVARGIHWCNCEPDHFRNIEFITRCALRKKGISR
jgi:hypothetical protein